MSKSKMDTCKRVTRSMTKNSRLLAGVKIVRKRGPHWDPLTVKFDADDKFARDKYGMVYPDFYDVIRSWLGRKLVRSKNAPSWDKATIRGNFNGFETVSTKVMWDKYGEVTSIEAEQYLLQ